MSHCGCTENRCHHQEIVNSYVILRKSHSKMLETLKGFADQECDFCIGKEGENNNWVHDKDCELMLEIQAAESLEVKP